ncbi:cation diffusion facilitator family transporter [Microbacterium aurantiacum]|uniref:Cation diffusion facilitator family transporter n=1 Tax=Microbacterium aurantiacum TaxID=162393 RepID=A0AAJ2HHS2_9MICO|nr:cation diffusion facilitator family transporter [Microbacterium aurantiacum]MDS0244293.1 cation diffusion facilitator family transporter [Microbacterium aurantiacum]
MGAGHSHATGDATPRKKLLIAFSITASVFVIEVIGAVITGSLALLVDAAHMLTDVIGLAMAVTAAHLMNRPPSERYTFGLRRAEVLAALAQAALLLGVGLFALVEGIRRLFEPPEIASGSLLFFGIVGLVANIAALLVLMSDRARNLNMRAAFLEVLNDALGSVGVIASAILIATLGWYRADAVAGILIALLIIPRTIILFRASGSVLLEATPPGLDLADVRRHILELPHVVAVHDLHASLVSTDLPILTAHVVVDDSLAPEESAQLLRRLQECVAEHFPVSIEHATFQLETGAHWGEGAAHT